MWEKIFELAMLAIYYGANIIVLVIVWLIVFMPLYQWLFGNGAHKKWAKWLTIEAYWEKYPACKTKDGSKCYYCGSRNIWQSGYESGADVKRIHQCRQCNTGLYRSGRK